MSTADCTEFLARHPDLQAHPGHWRRLSKRKAPDGQARVFQNTRTSWVVRVLETPTGLVLTHQASTPQDLEAQVPAEVSVPAPSPPRSGPVRLCLNEDVDPQAQPRATGLMQRYAEHAGSVSPAEIKGVERAFANRMLFALMGPASSVDPECDFEAAEKDDPDQYWTVAFVPEALWDKERLWSSEDLPIAGLLPPGSESFNGSSQWVVGPYPGQSAQEVTRHLLDQGFVWSESLFKGSREALEPDLPSGYLAWVKGGAARPSPTVRPKSPR